MLIKTCLIIPKDVIVYVGAGLTLEDGKLSPYVNIQAMGIFDQGGKQVCYSEINESRPDTQADVQFLVLIVLNRDRDRKPFGFEPGRNTVVGDIVRIRDLTESLVEAGKSCKVHVDEPVGFYV